MFIKTIIEFLQIYKKNMLSIIDHLMNENLENDLKKKKKKFKFKKKIVKEEAPLHLKFIRNLLESVWIYPALFAETWFGIFLSTKYKINYNKKLK